MEFNKTILASAMAIASGTMCAPAHANLTNSTVLNFVMGSSAMIGCEDGTAPPCDGSPAVTDIVGSFFAIDTNDDGVIDANEKNPIGSLNGIRIGALQAASGSHTGLPDGSENPDIDQPWAFLGNTGMHQTTKPITVLADNGSTKTLDFSGWSWRWNGIGVPLVDLGTTISCDTSSCSDGSSYTIDGAFHFSGSGFTSAPYFLHLEGSVSQVPVPAAAWLFSSGVAGLAGAARRRKGRHRTGSKPASKQQTGSAR